MQIGIDFIHQIELSSEGTILQGVTSALSKLMKNDR